MKTPSILIALLMAGASPLLSQNNAVESALDTEIGKLQSSLPGQVNINNRLRYERFDLDNGSPNRSGFSNRIRYGYTQPFGTNFSAMVEGETLFAIGSQDEIHPADERAIGTELNQLWLGYSHEDWGKGKLGRQIYTLDDHRFIGHVGWRQNIQTYDSITGSFTRVPNLVLNAFYIDQVLTPAGGTNDLQAFGVNASYKFGTHLTATAFLYDMEGQDNRAQSNRSFGVRAHGSHQFENVQFKYTASFVSQSNNNQNLVSYDANYWAGDLTFSFTGFDIGAGLEILEPGFRTPLATLHKFNGFADVFVASSGTGIPHGLMDFYLSAGTKIPLGTERVIPFKVIFHQFEPESGSGDYGDEVDLVVTYSISKHLGGTLKYGMYNSRGGSAGVGGADKTMLAADLVFSF